MRQELFSKYGKRENLLKKLMNKAVALLAAAVITAASGVLAAGSMDVSAAAKLATPELGIDVSSWQGDIDWNAVAAGGAKFAMIRVGNNAYGLDKKFQQNVAGATAAGLRVGAYVYTYATTTEQAYADAQLAISVLQGVPINFPVAIDIEDATQKPLSKEQQADIVNTFCQAIYDAGYRPAVYTSLKWFEERLAPVKWDHWVAQWNSQLDYQGDYAMWQFAVQPFAGIKGDCDLDFNFNDYYSEIVENGTATVDGQQVQFVNWRRVTGTRFDGTTYTPERQVTLTPEGYKNAPKQQPSTGSTASSAKNLEAAKQDVDVRNQYVNACNDQLAQLQAQADMLVEQAQKLSAQGDPNAQTAISIANTALQAVVDATIQLQQAQADLAAAQARLAKFQK